MTHKPANYVAVWGWLILLLIISLAAVKLPFSQPVTIVFIFIVAAVKAVIVAVYFMRLRSESRLIYAIAILPVILFAGMTLTLLPDIVFSPFSVQ
jgi:caa(3)-type oxidase subunit IV